MKNKFFVSKSLFLLILAAGITACSSASADQTSGLAPEITQAVPAAPKENAATGVVILSKINIQSGSPSETVRNFYKAIREKRFIDAMMMTNLKAGVENLSLEEAKDLAPDFEAMAPMVPTDLVITGEQISGNKASVFLKLPNEDNGNPTSDEMKLRKEGESWLILAADSESEEAKAKKQGKAYFFNVRIEVHHQEVNFMLERIMKAQTIISSDGKGEYAERDVLVRQGLLPVDINGSYSTGYNFSIVISPDKKSYFVNAVPAAYGKSGKLSFLMSVSGNNEPKTKSSDNGGMPLKR